MGKARETLKAEINRLDAVIEQLESNGLYSDASILKARQFEYLTVVFEMELAEANEI